VEDEPSLTIQAFTSGESPDALPSESPARLLTIGLSHRTASTEVRGKLSFSAEEAQSLAAHLNQIDGVNEAAVLSTCNRSEVYALARGKNAGNTLLARLAAWRGLSAEELRPYLYFLEDRSSIRHLFRVACGLDSMVLGETQILGQVKKAFQMAREAGAVQATLLRLSEHAVAGAKQVRTRTGIGGCPVSLAGAATAQIHRVVTRPKEARVLLIGAGENAELILRHLASRGTGEVWIANRTGEHAHALAGQYNAHAIPLDDIAEVLPRVNVVISSTASSEVILDAEQIECALADHATGELLLLDLAVPRDIAPEAGELAGIHLFSADDLGRLAKDNIRSRHEAAGCAEAIVEDEVSRYLEWLHQRAAVPAIRALRDNAETHRQKALKRALRRLENGMPSEEALDLLSRHLSGQLLHAPTRALTRAAQEDPGGDTVRTLGRLLDLPHAE
jgi:glutamyl-tRNA reductase